MDELQQARCIPCEGGVAPANAAEIAGYLSQISGWQVAEVDGVKRLTKIFALRNFVCALAFTNQVGALAEQEGHHPALLTEWGKVTVTWWTHSIGGLHKNDFVMAYKTDEAFQQASGAR
ncbi:MAG TPA: 4a-hydroxytetrahydrobiopterin dehydratase [Ktedonobacteraceae bacterium]